LYVSNDHLNDNPRNNFLSLPLRALTHRRRLRVWEYWHRRYGKPGGRSDGPRSGIAAALERSAAELGFSLLDLRCPPSNAVLDVLHCTQKVRIDRTAGNGFLLSPFLSLFLSPSLPPFGSSGYPSPTNYL